MPGMQQDNQIDECSNFAPRQQSESFSVGFLLQVINGASDPIFVKDRQHRWVLVNHAFCNLMGHSEEELIGKSDFDFFAKTEADVFWEKDELVFTTGLTDENEEFFTDVSGVTNFILTKKSFLEDELGNQFLVGTIRYITKRKLSLACVDMEKRVLERKMDEKNLMLYKQALDSSSDAIGIADATGVHIYHNPAFTKLYECQTPEEFGDRGSLGAVITNPLVAQKIWQTTVSGEAWIGEVEQRSFGARIIQTFLRSYPIKDSTGNNIGFVGAITDITERKLKEAQLQEQQQLLRSIFDGTENPIFVYDVIEGHDLRVVGWNAAAERGTGLLRAEVMGKTPEFVYSKLPLQGGLECQRFIKCIEVGQSITYEECLMFHHEETWWLTVLNPLKNSFGQIYRLVVTTSNITERKRAEIKLQQQTEDLQVTIQELQQTQMQLVQSEKMSSLGQLVAGVAHEINNPVNFIYGNLQHASDYIEDLLNLVEHQRNYPNASAEVEALAADIDLDFLILDLPKLLNSMKVGANRIKQIVASLRTFSRMDEADMKEVDIHEGIDSTLMILEHRFKAKPIKEAGREYLSPAIEVVKEYGELPLVECYAGQLNQVFMNILANAIDALEQSFVNSVTTCNPQIHIRTGIVAENQVIIYIVDNGPGVPEEIKRRLFDPFFTTKPVGKGTGMGLSISYQIITQRHGGSLECVSSPGGRTSFAITIPLRQGS
jgi:two-component system, NtrC family, sensor kinase